MNKKFAVFDIDGTVIRWQLYHAIVDRLVAAGKIDRTAFETARAARMAWKNRTHDTAFRDYEHKLVEIYDAAVTKISVADFTVAVETMFDEYKNQTYTYTRDLIGQLKARGYLLFGISASQIQAVELLAKHYDFDDWGGSVYEVKDGGFTGRKQVLIRDEKPKLLHQLATKHGASFAGSIAVGDSESDIPMLDSVENPIAFNPSRLLFEHASQQRWKIVVERKNMIYELEPKDGKYILAQTGE